MKKILNQLNNNYKKSQNSFLPKKMRLNSYNWNNRRSFKNLRKNMNKILNKFNKNQKKSQNSVQPKKMM